MKKVLNLTRCEFNIFTPCWKEGDLLKSEAIISIGLTALFLNIDF